ncbi:acetyl-CoA carboxylase carboxyltransferase subunit beta [Candidatus Gromoviella agglomerans]|uniref:acetyl-CoA carboxylase carboxyltransferase subunit beta n=1 Tax=Candidatus Gromoviella agglomerans TaxID=2806609 RepID=UPI001E4DCADA|nr:acetyl-CoA carboxylase carboxyltransferase subunit beta [Candidatus Gromoviella agglomerans]UFX98336.1 Acetyl-coenzyme A carboxylase carboxyl transferase subunit beta [Candidatus Gromoviella agglomerans]
MNSLPGINTINRKDFKGDLWTFCKQCSNLLLKSDLLSNKMVCSKCSFHHKIGTLERMSNIFDNNSYKIILNLDIKDDPIEFTDLLSYKDRLNLSRSTTQLTDAITFATGNICQKSTIVGVMNFDFIGGSLGLYVGESIVQACELASQTKQPIIIFTASGGARMQEGIISLMQMPRTCVAISEFKKKGGLYIVVLTHPTTGGVSASFAMLGDITLAEPGAIIGFAGQRVVENITGEKMPSNFQSSEFQFECGFIDKIVHRHDMKNEIGKLLSILVKNN